MKAVQARAASAYQEGSSLLHEANPLTKLSALAWIVTAAFVLPSPLLWLGVGLMLFAGFAFGFGLVVLRRYLVLALPFAIAVFIFHGWIIDRPDARLGFLGLPYSGSGLDHAGLLTGRISLMLAGALLFVTTTSPSVLLRSFDAARWPPALSFLMASPLLLVDQFSTRAAAIRDAQQTRGLDTSSLLAKVKALRILIVPLVTSALSEAHERSNVLTARGFRAMPHRTVLFPPPDSRTQRGLRFTLLALSLLQIGIALWRL